MLRDLLTDRAQFLLTASRIVPQTDRRGSPEYCSHSLPQPVSDHSTKQIKPHTFPTGRCRLQYQRFMLSFRRNVIGIPKRCTKHTRQRWHSSQKQSEVNIPALSHAFSSHMVPYLYPLMPHIKVSTPFSLTSFSRPLDTRSSRSRW